MVMGFYNRLSETLKQRSFDEKPRKSRNKLNSKQCQALASHFSVNLDKFFGTVVLRQQPSSASSSSTILRGWNSLEGLYNETFSKWWSMRRVNISSSAVLSYDDGLSPILEELKIAPQGIEELYRVIKEAENFLVTCSNPDWWRSAVTIAVTSEARDVHTHDLVWCIAGLKLVLHRARGVGMESRAQFCRLGIAESYAQLETLSAQNSDLVRNEEQDHDDLLSNLQKMKQKYDGMNPVRKKLATTDKKLKRGTADFLLQKLASDSAPFATKKPPQSMQIRREDLTFSSPLCLIGSGAYGKVYKASWLGMEVAAKQFDYENCKDLFESEAAILAELRCPFIVQLIGWCVDIQNNTCCLVLELVKTNLTNFVRDRRELNKPPRLPVLVDSMLQISRGMEYLHSRRIMHRDLNPRNILVQPLSSCKELREQGYVRIKLCDFGLAREKLESCNSMTSKVGTLCYMAPEVWASSNGLGTEGDRVKYSFEADVFSFSMTFAFSLTGKVPFEGIKSGTVLMDKLRKGERPELPSNCPKFLNEFIQKCWSANPSSRPSFPSISMTLRHLKLLLMTARNPERRLDLLEDKVFLSTPAVSYHEIFEATGGFTRRVQNITADSIYQGELFDRTPVLVHLKQSLVDPGNFWAEVSQMLNLRHGNIVRLQAVCNHHTQCWFLYEHASVQGSLDTWVENPTDKILKPLDEDACYRVAVGVANGLQYLHSQNVFNSVTTQNILLNERFEPQILLNSPLCEEKVGLADRQRRSDVSHFRELIAKLLLHLSNNCSHLETASSLKEVERLCLNNTDVTMDEVVEMLEAHIFNVPDSLDANVCIEDNIDCKEPEYSSSDTLSEC